jgi:hypothetical protein
MSATDAIAIAALVVAVIAYVQARRTARQLAQMTELYWQLKFDHGELKAKVDPPAPSAPQPKETFVPLTRLRPPSPTATAGQAPREAGSSPDK